MKVEVDDLGSPSLISLPSLWTQSNIELERPVNKDGYMTFDVVASPGGNTYFWR